MIIPYLIISIIYSLKKYTKLVKIGIAQVYKWLAQSERRLHESAGLANNNPDGFSAEQPKSRDNKRVFLTQAKGRTRKMYAAQMAEKKASEG